MIIWTRQFGAEINVNAKDGYEISISGTTFTRFRYASGYSGGNPGQSVTGVIWLFAGRPCYPGRARDRFRRHGWQTFCLCGSFRHDLVCLSPFVLVGLVPGDEVITVANSDISTTSAIRQCGATPIFCDVQANDFTIDAGQVEALISAKTRALLPVDLYGHPADAAQLRAIADQYNLAIIEDAALATGAEDYGKPVGAFADATIFSFAPFKPLGSVGNGAMIVTDDEALQRQLRLLVEYGHAQKYEDIAPGHQYYVAEGYNIPLDPLQAALVFTKLPYLPQWTAQRQAIVHQYEEGLQGSTAVVPVFRDESNPTFPLLHDSCPRTAANLSGFAESWCGSRHPLCTTCLSPSRL